MFTGPAAHPCSDTGRLQSDINRIENQLRNKADSYNIQTLSKKIDLLVQAIRDVDSVCDTLLSRIEACEIKQQELEVRIEQ